MWAEVEGQGGASTKFGMFERETSAFSRIEADGMTETARSRQVAKGFGWEARASCKESDFRASTLFGRISTERFEELSGNFRSFTRFDKEVFTGVRSMVEVDGIPWLNLEVGYFDKVSVRKDFSLLAGHSRHESSSGLKALDLVTTVLSKDTMEASDALCFTYHKRTASYKAGFFGGTGSEHVQLPFIQFRREGSASLNKEGRIELGQDAVLTEVSLSDVTRGSIRGTANYLYAKNNHNLDAGLGEILGGFREIGKGIVADELAHGFCDAMSGRGYPAKSVERAYQLVAKPLYRAWKQKGFQGVMDYQNTSDILGELKDHAISDPVAFVTDAVNTAAPLLGSDLHVQWDENYKGFNVLGNGVGWGTQVDTGTERTVSDTGLHASRRFRSTLNTVGVSGCLGKSVETVSRRFADDTGHLASTTETWGARAKADILGVNIAEIRAGYVRSERNVQERAEFGGLPGVKQTQEKFQGLAAAGRLGVASIGVGLGQIQESSVGTSSNGSAEYVKDVSCFGASGSLRAQDRDSW